MVASLVHKRFKRLISQTRNNTFNSRLVNTQATKQISSVSHVPNGRLLLICAIFVLRARFAQAGVLEKITREQIMQRSFVIMR